MSTFSKIKIKRSTTGAVPTGLEFGELAYSSGSGKLYFGSSTDGTTIDIFEIGGKSYTDKINAGVTIGTTNIAIGGTETTLNGLTLGATTIAGNFIPSENEAYDLGSNSFRFRDLYLSGSTINLGTATLTADGSNVVLANKGTVVTTGDTGTITNTMLANSSVTINGGEVSLGGTLTLTTDNVQEAAENPTNQYFTTSRARAVFSAATSGTGYGSLSYADGVFTFAKVTDAEIRGAFSAGTGITYDNATGIISIPQSVATDADVTFNSLTIASTPTNANHAATKAYVDSKAAGLSWQEPVSTITDEAPTSDPFFASGTRYLNSLDSKIYTSTGTAWDAGVSPSDNWAVFASDTDQGWTYNGTSWVQFTGTGQINAGDGLSKDGNTLNVVVDNSTIEIVADALLVKDAGITNTKLATGAVTSDKLAESAVDLSTSTVTGTLPITNGGTGQTTAALAFDALAPTTTRGDIIVRNDSGNTRLSLGAAKSVLTSDGTDASWGNISFANTLYVSKTGNDTTGDGSFNNPYASVTKAMEMVGTPTINNAMLIQVGAGRYTEPGALTIKPWVWIKGVGGQNVTRITATGLSLDAAWTANADDRAGMVDLTINCAVTLDFAAAQAQQGKWYSNNVIYNSTLTITGGYSINQFNVTGGVVFGTLTLNGNQGTFVNLLAYGNVVVNQSPTANVANHYATFMNSFLQGNVTLNSNNAALNNMPLSLLSTPVGGNLTINGNKGSLTVTSDSMPNRTQFTNTDNMTVYRKNDAFGVNVNSQQAAYWSSLGVNPYDGFNVEKALDALVVPVWNNKVNLRSVVTVTDNASLPRTGDLAGYSESVILVDTSAKSITITLPSSIDWSEKYWTIKKVDNSTNTVTITAPTGQTIDGVQTFVLTEQYEDVTVVATGTTDYAKIQSAITDGGTY